jgi:hypothetical protein
MYCLLMSPILFHTDVWIRVDDSDRQYTTFSYDYTMSQHLNKNFNGRAICKIGNVTLSKQQLLSEVCELMETSMDCPLHIITTISKLLTLH